MEVLLCIYGLDSLLPDVKAMKKFKENLACRLINFCNTLNQASLQIVEQFNGLKQYFLVDAPAKQPSILHNKRHKKISDQLKHKYFLAEIHFVAAVADAFSRFLLVLFQKDELSIHMLHAE